MLPAEIVLDAERHLLGCIAQDPQALAAVRQAIEPHDLSIDLHRRLLRAMIELTDQGIRPDRITITRSLGADLELLGGPEKILGALEHPGVAVNVPGWAAIVRQAARHRARVTFAHKLELAQEHEEHATIEHWSAELARLNGGGSKRRTRTALDIASTSGDPIPSLLGEALLPKGYVTMIHGRGGLGKTYLLFGLSLAIANGHDWLAVDTTPGRVAIVTYEVPEGAARMFIREWSAYSSTEPPHQVEICTAEDTGGPLFDEGQAALANFIREKQADLLIVDPFRSAHTRDENDNSAMAGLMDMLRAVASDTGAAILLSHHDRKGRPGDAIEDQDAGRGSSAIKDAVRASWRLYQAKGQLCLDFEKVSFGTPPDPVWLKKRPHQPPEVTLAPEEGSRTGRKNRLQRMKELLRSEPEGLSVAQLCERLSMGVRAVKKYLAEIPGAHNLCHPGQEGRWTLIQPMHD